MKRILLCSVLFVTASLTLIGCGGTVINTDPLTDEQKAAIKAEDNAVDEDESPGNKTRKEKKKR